MGPSKKAIVTAATILMFVLSGVIIAGTLYVLIGAAVEEDVTFPIIFTCVIALLLAVADLVIGALYAKKPENKTLLILLLVFYVLSLFVVPSATGDTRYTSGILFSCNIIFALAGTALCIVAISLPDKRKQAAPIPPFNPYMVPPHGMPPQGMPPQGMPPQGMPPQGMPPHGMLPHAPVPELHQRIESLQKLRDSGSITQEEFKELLLKELEK